MNTLQPGDILINEGKEEIKVIAVHTCRVWTTELNGGPAYKTMQIANLTKYGWTKKETPWMPEIEQEVWYIFYDGTVESFKWLNHKQDQAIASFFGVFKTKEEAIARAEEIIGLIKK